jgi:Uma2 family endonuclease
MAVQLSRRVFTVHEYHLMGKAGILTEDDRVELLDGEIVQMTPIGSRHAYCVDRLTQLLVEGLARRALVRVQSPVRLSEHSEPQPDVALLRPDRSYATAHPGPPDILLLIEVAETSVETDRQVKVPMYARAGVPETWVIDLTANRVEVYRQPTSEGYRSTERIGRGNSLAPQVFPELMLSVDDLL